MEHFYIILFKINIVLILFAAAYYLILRRLTFYTLNRFFLVFGIVFATAYPFINLTDFFHRQKQINEGVAQFVPKINQRITEMVPSNFITANWQIISLLFYIGVLVMAVRLAMQFISLYLMHRKSEPGTVGNYPVRILGESVSPFSFWQTVYINPSLHQETELQTILEHEKIHVKQWHSLDIILAELSVVFYWFNPGVWMMKKAVKENLEFITDQKILNNGIDRKAYQYSLLDVGNLTPSVAIVNNFNLSDLKKRIMMMNSKRSSPISLGRYLLITPLLLLTTLAFTVSKKEMKHHLLPLTQVLIRTGESAEKGMAAVADVITLKETKKLKKKSVNLVPAKSDSVKKVFRFIHTVRFTTDSVGNDVDLEQAKKLLTKVIVTNIKLNKYEGVRVSQSFNLGNDSANPITQNKELTEALLEKGNGEVVTVVGYPRAKQNDDGTPQKKQLLIFRGHNLTSDTATLKNVKFFVGGVNIDRADVNKLDPETIKSINIRKTEMAGEVRIVVGKKKEQQ